MNHFNILISPVCFFSVEKYIFTEVVTYRDECYYLQMFALHQMMTIAYKSEQKEQQNENKLTTLSLTFIMLGLYMEMSI